MEKYFFEAFENMKRLGPGSEDSTLQAIKCIDKTKSVKILDVGCGVGTHTFLLAEELENAEIIAIDNSEDYINKLNNTAKELNLDNRVKGVCMSMFEMTFDDNTFDYIFAEGAIYIAGFTNGLTDWKRYLKEDGMIICSEISWITDELSDEAKSYWEGNYPQIDSVKNKIAQAKEIGYELRSNYVLPKTDWTDNYYVPLQRNIDEMRVKYIGNDEAMQVVDMIQEEIDMYDKHNDEYSYVFYNLQSR